MIQQRKTRLYTGKNKKLRGCRTSDSTASHYGHSKEKQKRKLNKVTTC